MIFVAWSVSDPWVVVISPEMRKEGVYCGGSCLRRKRMFEAKEGVRGQGGCSRGGKCGYGSIMFALMDG